MADSDPDRLVGEDRCWPCTVSNALVAAVIAVVPLLGGLTHGDPWFFLATVGWAVAVLGYTLYRLVSRGYLPGAEAIAKRTGLHERVGPGAKEDEPDAGSGREGRGE